LTSKSTKSKKSSKSSKSGAKKESEKKAEDDAKQPTEEGKSQHGDGKTDRDGVPSEAAALLENPGAEPVLKEKGWFTK